MGDRGVGKCDPGQCFWSLAPCSQVPHCSALPGCRELINFPLAVRSATFLFWDYALKPWKLWAEINLSISSSCKCQIFYSVKGKLTKNIHKVNSFSFLDPGVQTQDLACTEQQLQPPKVNYLKTGFMSIYFLYFFILFTNMLSS